MPSPEPGGVPVYEIRLASATVRERVDLGMVTDFSLRVPGGDRSRVGAGADGGST